MLLTILILIPFIGIIFILSLVDYDDTQEKTLLKFTAMIFSGMNLVISFIIWILFDNSSISFQFIQERYTIGNYDFYLGLDSISIYFVLLTTLIIPLSIVSNWKSLKDRLVYFLVIMLLLEALLLLIFLVLDLLMFYIFFESILAPLFILIGLFGSSERLRASFYFFLYTFLGSLFMLLSIISMLSLVGCTDINILSKSSFLFITQVFMFLGIFIAFAVKTPVIYLNGWLLKAHVESPLSGSIILAAIVLKLSLYGIFRLILPVLPKAFIYYTFVVFLIAVLTIIYASLSTLRTVDVKELIAYSSVSHAAVYLAGVLSNTIQGIQGGICLGLAHGFVSSGLFSSVGGILYDRSGTRLISYYGGIAQVMPIFSILLFLLCLGNCGAPLTFNFVGEFMSIYGVFERLTLAGVFASSSIIFSAAFTIFMFNRIAFAGNFNFENWENYLPDLNRREYSILLVVVLFTIMLGIYPSLVLDVLGYGVSGTIYIFDSVFTIRTLSFAGNSDDFSRSVQEMQQTAVTMAENPSGNAVSDSVANANGTVDTWTETSLNSTKMDKQDVTIHESRQLAAQHPLLEPSVTQAAQNYEQHFTSQATEASQETSSTTAGTDTSISTIANEGTRNASAQTIFNSTTMDLRDDIEAETIAAIMRNNLHPNVSGEDYQAALQAQAAHDARVASDSQPH